ncbi:MAG: hypothetical protein AAB325_04455 [Pseudomonadota bacterium]
MEPVPPERMPGERLLEGRHAYEQALDELIANAAHTVRIFDRNIGPDFNSPQRYELLRQLLLARPANRVCLVLHETANIVRDCPRLIALLRQFSDGVSIRRTLPDARGVYDPFAVADDTRFVRRFHFDGGRGIATVGDIAATSLLLKRYEEIWQASAPALAATTLGL